MLPTSEQYDSIELVYGEPAALALCNQIGKTRADSNGVIKLGKAPAQLVAHAAFDEFVAIKCYLQRVQIKAANLRVAAKAVSPSSLVTLTRDD